MHAMFDSSLMRGTINVTEKEGGDSSNKLKGGFTIAV